MNFGPMCNLTLMQFSPCRPAGSAEPGATDGAARRKARLFRAAKIEKGARYGARYEELQSACQDA
jgi:hypothetical protein